METAQKTREEFFVKAILVPMGKSRRYGVEHETAKKIMDEVRELYHANCELLRKQIITYPEHDIKLVELESIIVGLQLNSMEYVNDKPKYDLIVSDAGKRLEEWRRSIGSATDKAVASQAKHKTTPIKEVVMPQSKLTYSIFEHNEASLFMMKDSYLVDIEERLDQNKIYSYLSIDPSMLDDIPGLKLSRRLNEFDYAVYNAICSLYAAGNRIITLNMIYSVLAGMKKTLPSTGKVEITQSIYVLNSAILRRVGGDYRGNARLIEIEWVDTNLNGIPVVAAIEITKMPVLLRMAGNNVLRIPLEANLVDINNTKNTIILKSYIIRRIAKHRMQPAILLETLYKKILEASDTKKTLTDVEKRRIREDAIAIFEHQMKIGFIKSYKIESQGRTKYHKIVFNR